MSDCESRVISGIPALTYIPRETPRAAVLLYHGLGSAMESYAFFASLVSHWGYKVVVPEIPHHGVRGTLDYADPKAVQKHFWSIVRQGVRELEGIAAVLRKENENLSVIGHSLGGFIAAGAFSEVSCLQSAVVINSSCAWAKFEEHIRELHGLHPMTEEERKALQELDPLTRAAFGDRKRLLLLHGKDDTTVPIDSQRYFVRMKADVPGEYLEFVEYAGVNHLITLGMLEKIKKWLDRLYPQG